MKNILTILLLFISAYSYGQVNWTPGVGAWQLKDTTGGKNVRFRSNVGIITPVVTLPVLIDSLNNYTKIGSSGITSITPGFGFTSTTPITSTGTLTIDTTKLQAKLTPENVGIFMDISLPTKITPTGSDALLARDNITNEAVEILYGSLLSTSANSSLSGTGERIVSVASNGTPSATIAYREIVNITSAAGTLALDKSGVYTFTGTTATWTLPAVTGNTLKNFTIINAGSGTLTLNSNSGGNDIWEAGANVNTLSIPSMENPYTIINNSLKYVIK